MLDRRMCNRILTPFWMEYEPHRNSRVLLHQSHGLQLFSLPIFRYHRISSSATRRILLAHLQRHFKTGELITTSA